MGFSKKLMPLRSMDPCSKNDFVCRSPSPKNSDSKQPIERKPLDKAALDAKYTKPELLSKFVCYFGMHKGKTFGEILKDTPSYADFCMRMEPKTNCMYLFQRYITATRSSAEPE